MQIVMMSDTHELHHDLDLPGGDLLIHTGDFCDEGNIEGIYDFLGWLADTDFKYKILIAGNHDFFVEDHPEKFQSLLPKDVIYLEDSGIEVKLNNLFSKIKNHFPLKSANSLAYTKENILDYPSKKYVKFE